MMNIQGMENSAEYALTAPLQPSLRDTVPAVAKSSEGQAALDADSAMAALQALLPRLNDAELWLLRDQLRQVARRTYAAAEVRAMLARLTLDSLAEMIADE